jgi:hypothetical protein
MGIGLIVANFGAVNLGCMVAVSVVGIYCISPCFSVKSPISP